MPIEASIAEMSICASPNRFASTVASPGGLPSRLVIVAGLR